jgi:hypothetical protein
MQELEMLKEPRILIDLLPESRLERKLKVE